MKKMLAAVTGAMLCSSAVEVTSMVRRAPEPWVDCRSVLAAANNVCVPLCSGRVGKELAYYESLNFEEPAFSAPALSPEQEARVGEELRIRCSITRQLMLVAMGKVDLAKRIVTPYTAAICRSAKEQFGKVMTPEALQLEYEFVAVDCMLRVGGAEGDSILSAFVAGCGEWTSPCPGSSAVEQRVTVLGIPLILRKATKYDRRYTVHPEFETDEWNFFEDICKTFLSACESYVRDAGLLASRQLQSGLAILKTSRHQLQAAEGYVDSLRATNARLASAVAGARAELGTWVADPAEEQKQLSRLAKAAADPEHHADEFVAAVKLREQLTARAETARVARARLSKQCLELKSGVLDLRTRMRELDASGPLTILRRDKEEQLRTLADGIASVRSKYDADLAAADREFAVALGSV
jgi:hypothetical protein